MDKLFEEQRLGYEFALDRLIRDAKPKEIVSRCEAFGNLEDASEFEYGNVMMLRHLYGSGLGDFRTDFLSDLNQDDSVIDMLSRPSPDGFYDRQRFVRDRTDNFLLYALSFIDGWRYGDVKRGDAKRAQDVEERRRRLMVDRQIISKGLGNAIMITAPLERKLIEEFGMDSSEYDSMHTSSIDFVNEQEANPDNWRNVYLLVNEDSTDMDAPFPALPLESLKRFGLINGALSHAFLHFPVRNFSDNGYNYGSVNWTREGVNGVSLETDYGTVCKYMDNFDGPNVAITTLERSGYVRDLFQEQGAHVMTVS